MAIASLVRNCSCLLVAIGQPYAHELPTHMGWEKVAISGPNVRQRRGAGASAQHHLVAHEFAVVLTDRAGGRLEPGVGNVRARGPLPDVAEHLHERLAAGRGLRMQHTVIHEVSSYAA